MPVAYPTTREYGAGSSSGAIVTWSAQPDNWAMLRAPLRRTPFGVKRDGRDAIRLIWGNSRSGINFAQHGELVKVYTDALAAGGPWYLRYWNEDTGAYVTVKCAPQPPEHQGLGFDRYLGVTMEFRYLGMA